MDAVGDMGDRHALQRAPREQRLPHAARHLAVALTDGVGATAATQRQRGHARRLRDIGRVDAAQRQEAFAVAAGIGHAAEHRQQLVARIGLVAGGHRRVRGEHHLLAHLLPGRVVAHVGPARARLRQQLEHTQRRMAFVQVIDGRFDAQRLQCAHAADAEHRVLRQADGAVALVQA